MWRRWTSAGISAARRRDREAGKRTLRAGRRWETRGARSARAEAKETQADIVARASDQWRAGAAIGTHAFLLRTRREAHGLDEICRSTRSGEPYGNSV